MTVTSRKIEDYTDREVLDALISESVELGAYRERFLNCGLSDVLYRERETSTVINILYNEAYARMGAQYEGIKK